LRCRSQRKLNQIRVILWRTIWYLIQFIAAIARFADAQSSPHAPATNPALRPKAFGNTPSRESDESPLEEIMVADARHPLFGRKFKVIRCLGRVGNCLPSYEVEYLGDYRLLVPIAATVSSAAMENHTKLSFDALNDLILAAELIENGKDQSGRALGDAVSELAPSDCRRAGSDIGGDTP
jgi:hypothetical protein